MSRKFLIPVAVAAAMFSVSAVAAAPTHFAGEALSGKAKVDLAQARSIALKVRPGTIVDQELEKEAGGSGLRYSFDIKAASKTYEVGVDAATGRVLENGGETASKEAAEAKTEASEAKHVTSHAAERRN